MKAPAIGLVVANLLGLAFVGAAFVAAVVWVAMAIENPMRFLLLFWYNSPFALPVRLVAVGLLPALLVWAGLAIISFIGAIRMRCLQDYRLAVTGSILVMLVSPPLGLVFGGWALIVLMRPEVRQAFGHGHGLPPRGGGGANAAVATIAVTVCVGALLLAVIGSCVLLSNRTGAGRRSPEATATQPGEMVQTPLARNQICAVRCEGLKATIEYEIDAAHEILLFVGSEALGWSSWHAGGTTGCATVEASDQVRQRGSSTRGFLFQTEAVRHYVAITPDGPVPFGELGFRPDGEITQDAGTFTFADIRQADGTRVPISVRIRPVANFGPVIELTVTSMQTEPSSCCLDLDAGELRVPPPGVRESLQRMARMVDSGSPPGEVSEAMSSELFDWLQESGTDLLGTDLGDGLALFLFGEHAHRRPRRRGDFDTISPRTVSRASRGTQPEAAGDAHLTQSIPVHQAGLHRQPHDPADLIFFHTRGGHDGVLQMVGSTDDPPGARLRYKLVQGMTAAALADDAAAFLRFRLQSARRRLLLAEAEYKKGTVGQDGVLKARFTKDIAEAELAGDAAAVLRLGLQLARQELLLVEARHKAGVASQGELLKARSARDIAQAELAGDAVAVLRLKLQLTQQEFLLVEARHKSGTASVSELLRARLAKAKAEAEYAKLAPRAKGK